MATVQTSGLKAFESGSTTAKPGVDDDDDELEALRAAALMSMKAREKHKPKSLNSEVRERPGPYATYSRYHYSNQRATSGKPLFSWSQRTRPNLIVIQPVPLEGSEAAPPCNRTSIQTAQPSAKLVLPQDRWCPQRGQDSPASTSSGPSKRRASGKFSHFESSSESEDSDDDLLPSGSVSSRSDPSHRQSSDDEQNSASCLSPLRDSLDGCLSESTSDLPVSSRWNDISSEAGTAGCARESIDLCSALHTSRHGSSDDIDSGVVHAPSQESAEDSDDSTPKEPLGSVNRLELSVSDGLKNSAVPNENVPRLPISSPDLDGSHSDNGSPLRHTCRKSPAREEYPQKHEARLTNGAALDIRKVHLAPDNQKEDWLAPLSSERNSSREGTPKSTRNVDSRDRTASSVFEARRRKFESTVPVKPVGGKIVLLRGQGKTDEMSPYHENSPLRSPRAPARSRSRSTSPPVLRSVLSVVKLGPGEACAEPKKKRRSGRTAEMIVHSADEESSDASDRITCSNKLPVHLRLGDSSAASMTKKKKSKRKRSSHDSSGYSAKRKHTKGRVTTDPDVRHTWRGPEPRRRRKCVPLALCDGTP